MNKRGMTLEEHHELGKKLKEVEKVLEEAERLVSSRYGGRHIATIGLDNTIFKLRYSEAVINGLLEKEAAGNSEVIYTEAQNCYHGELT